MKKQKTTTSTGVSTLSLLGISFIVLKLCKVINWSWWMVTLPFWGGIALVLVIFLIFFSVMLILDRK